MITGVWAKGQKDRRGRSSPLLVSPFDLRSCRPIVEPILTTFCRSRSWTKVHTFEKLGEHKRVRFAGPLG